MVRTVLTLVVRTGDDDLVAFLNDGDGLGMHIGELAEGAFDGNRAILDGDLDSGRNRNGLLTDTGHI